MNRALAERGFTLVELILVAAILGLVVVAVAGLVRNSYHDWKLGDDRSTLLQDGRAIIEKMSRILRQSKGFNSVSSPTDTAGYITFTDVEGLLKEFRLNTAANELQYGEPADLSVMAGNVSELLFTCYDIDANSLAEPVKVRKIRAVNITVTLVNPDDSAMTFTLSGRVFCYEDFLNEITINEIMYNPENKQADGDIEWVELYNMGSSVYDMNGWSIWTTTSGSTDQLMAHPQFGNGSTAIPAGGYAVITAQNTDVYTELMTNGGFESKLKSEWQLSNWSRTKPNAHFGSYKLESVVSGSAWAYQDITVPLSFNSCLFLFWEKTTAPIAQTQITVTIRNLSDVILATVYSAQMSAVWTCHTIDLSAYANQSIRIHFSTNKTTAAGALLLDDVSVAASYVAINATRLSVDDSKIGNGLDNSDDTVCVTSASRIIDNVTYSNTWGGNGDGTSLARIDPDGSSNDSSNWTSGPVNGTPGSAN